jgi:endogenous inhibitor of DNA gyrase (YacG/DUF329 family)
MADLGRWLSGDYRVPLTTSDANDDLEREDALEATDEQ